MKTFALSLALLAFAAPALADESPPPDVAALMQARDAQAQRYDDAQTLPGLIDGAALASTAVTIFGGGVMLAGAAGGSVQSALVGLGGFGILLCGGVSTVGLLLTNLALDKRVEEADKLSTAQSKLDDAVKGSLETAAQAY